MVMGSIKILFVEDNPGDQYIVSQLLLEKSKIHYELTQVSRLNDALRALESESFDACLLDLSLPDSYGLDTLINVHRNNPKLPIVVLTDLNDDRTELEAIALGAQDYLVKDQINQIWLSRTISHAIERSQLIEKLQEREAQLKVFNQELLSHAEERSETIVQMSEEVRSLHQLSLTDALTGISNRRGFEEFLDKWRYTIADLMFLSAIMIDIDFFKQYNDTYGHPMGDICLVNVARAISSALKRPRDFAARYGGEEFIVILPDAPEAGVIKVAKSIQAAIAALSIPHAASPICDQVTVSLGIATTLGRPEMLVAHADQALYQAKQNGRDRWEKYLPDSDISSITPSHQ